MRAARVSAGKISGPSDPLLVTTDPDIPESLEKPTVPVFDYYIAGDDYADLAWSFEPVYNYYIKYAASDNISQAGNGIQILPEEMLFRNTYRIEELEPNTLYYFWIQAEAVGSDGETLRSEWSDSFLVKTLPLMPPETPNGFGLKNSTDAVTKNSLTFEWIQEDTLLYIIEIADNPDYVKAMEHSAGSIPEYRVEGLRSNCRYYARLYAFDAEKNLKSAPTQTIMVRTERSTDDYDSDQDSDSVLTGEFIIKDPYSINGKWNVRIVGTNALRFIEHVQNDRILDYVVDLSVMPENTKTIVVRVSAMVFEALSQLKENFIFNTEDYMLVIRPEVMDIEQAKLVADGRELEYELCLDINKSKTTGYGDSLTYKTDITGIAVKICMPEGKITAGSLNRPLKVVYEYVTQSFYSDGITYGFLFNSGLDKWQKLPDTSVSYNPYSQKGYVSVETIKTGDIVLGEYMADSYNDISYHWARTSINKIASKYDLTSVDGSSFRPAHAATINEAAGLMLDVTGNRSSGDYITPACKSGMLPYEYINKPQMVCTRELAIYMAVRLYELKSGEKAKTPAYIQNVFKDMADVSTQLLPRIKFAVENGLVVSRFSDTFGPKDSMTRGEFMALIEKVLILCGEL